jgi:hypothetical protein
VFVARFLIRGAIPDVPKAVEDHLARQVRCQPRFTAFHCTSAATRVCVRVLQEYLVDKHINGVEDDLATTGDVAGDDDVDDTESVSWFHIHDPPGARRPVRRANSPRASAAAETDDVEDARERDKQLKEPLLA